MRIPSILSRPLAALALLGLFHLFASPLAATPGEGQISGGKFDVLVYFTYPEADPESWEPVFEEYSKLLLNATEGGLQLGRVEFTTCSSLADEADIWVLNDNSGARAHIGGLGRSGQHITISQTHRSISGVAMGQFGLAHETGHYVWALYDEYLGFIGVFPGTSSQHFCSSASGIAACLMDGGTTIFPNNQRTEFCTDVSSAFAGTVHNAGIIDAQGMLVRTDQEFVYSTSCWRQIQRDGDAGLLHPFTEPLDIDLVHDPVTFVRDRFLGTLAMALLIDTSGSMSGDGRLEAAIMGSELALGMTRDGETQAVYAFDDRLRTLIAPQIVNVSRRANAITKVGQLQASGGTEAGDALMEVAVEMGDVNGCRKFIVLLTDGVSDDPDVNESEVILELQSNDVLVYPVALGSFPDDAALMELASSTGGQYFHAPRPEDVPAIFAEIFTLAGGGAALGSFQGPGAPLGQVTAMEIEVPKGADALVVALSASGESGPVLGLVGPRGETIRSDGVPPGVEMIQAGDVLLLRLFAPAPGEWEVGFTTLQGVAERVTLFAAAESRLLSITTSTDRDVLSRTQLLHIETSVVSAVPVAGADVRGSVLRPDGVRVELQLFDDGHPANGDLQAGDGVYSAYFSDVGDEGLYRFDLDVINIDGIAASNRECGLYGASPDDGEGREEGGGIHRIAPFRAHSSRTVLVQGNGTNLRQGAVHLREHVRGPDPTEGGALAFGLAVAAQEPVALQRLEFRLTSQSSFLGGYELHLDLDRDGRIDRPRRALARARMEGDRLVLENPGGALALLPAGQEAGFILLRNTTLDVADPTLAGGGVNPTGNPQGFLRMGPWLAAVFALVVLSHAKRRVERVRSFALLVLVLGIVFVPLSPSCSMHQGNGPEPVTLDPADLALQGAVTGQSIVATGQPLHMQITR